MTNPIDIKLSLPGPDAPGFIPFLREIASFERIIVDGQTGMTEVNALESFLVRVMSYPSDYDEKISVINKLSRDQFLDVIKRLKETSESAEVPS